MSQISKGTKAAGGTDFTAHTTAASAEINADSNTLFNAHNNHDSGTSKWTVVSALNAAAVPLIADNGAGSNDIANFKANGVTKVQIASTGAVTLSAALAMGTNKITGGSAATAATDFPIFSQLKVLQYQSATSTTNFSTTSATFQLTNLTVNITPSSASSKVLILVTGNIKLSASGGSNAGVTIARNTTNLLGSAGYFYQVSTSIGNTTSPVSIAYIDSPASASALTYAVYVRSSDGASTAEFPGSANTTQLISVYELA